MANTSSAKKAVRSSKKKQIHNLGWKKRIKSAVKNILTLVKDGKSAEDLKSSLSAAQKVLDKAAKENVMHRNKANRIKSKLAKKLSKSSDVKPTASLSSFISYLNIRNDNLSTTADDITEENINFIGSKETVTLDLKQDTKFLNDYKQKTFLIKNKYYNFFDTVSSLRESLGNIYLDTLVYTNSENVFNFRISFFSKNKDLEQDIQKLKEVNKRITSMKMESIEKIEGTTDYKYVFNGVIDGR